MNTVASFWRCRCRILLLGLDNAGKSTLLYRLKLNETVATKPTTGFNVETFDYKNIAFMTWDLGGQSHLRKYWECYFPDCDAIVFVVDAADRDRLDEAAKELHAAFQHEELKKAKLLVFANKQDHAEAMKLEEISSKLNLPAVTKNAYHLKPIVATTGAGVDEGIRWLAQSITAK